MSNYILPAHRDYVTKCRIAHALSVADQLPDNEVCEALQIDSMHLQAMVARGRAHLRFIAAEAPKPKLRSEPVERQPRKWTRAELEMLERNRQKFRAMVLDRMAEGKAL